MISNSLKVYIVVLNWNNWRDTLECLESIYQVRYGSFQVVCIDNGSTDGSIDKIREWASGSRIVESNFVPADASAKPIKVILYDRMTAESGGDPEEEAIVSCMRDDKLPLILIRSGANLGYAGGNNIGIKYALNKGDSGYIWILNNDTVVEENALDEIVSAVDCDRNVGMAGSKLLYYGEPGVLQAAGGGKISPWMGNAALLARDQKDDGRWNCVADLDYICGASLLVKKEVIENIGLLDDSYFLYWEDVDWGMRARIKRYALVYCAGSKVWHKEEATSEGTSCIADYYWTRNGLFFMKKFYRWLLPLTLLSYLMKHTVLRLIRKQPTNFSAFIKGLQDFLKRRTGKWEDNPESGEE